MSEEIGKEIGNNIGNYVETNKRSWQTNQAKFMQICVELQIDKPLRKGGGTSRIWRMKEYGSPSSMKGYPLYAMYVEE